MIDCHSGFGQAERDNHESSVFQQLVHTLTLVSQAIRNAPLALGHSVIKVLLPTAQQLPKPL